MNFEASLRFLDPGIERQGKTTHGEPLSQRATYVPAKPFLPLTPIIYAATYILSSNKTSKWKKPAFVDTINTISLLSSDDTDRNIPNTHRRSTKDNWHLYRISIRPNKTPGVIKCSDTRKVMRQSIYIHCGHFSVTSMLVYGDRFSISVSLLIHCFTPSPCSSNALKYIFPASWTFPWLPLE